MKIRLVRHGPPEFDDSVSVDRHNFAAMLQKYNESIVVRAARSKCAWVSEPEFRGAVVSSQLLRATSSATQLGLTIDQTSALLNEAGLPHPSVLPWNMRWKTALVVWRIAWLLGYNKNADGLLVDQARAKQAAQWLVGLAAAHSEVVAFGHGIMHRLIARKLLATGWQSGEKAGNGFWSSQVLTYTAT